MLTDRELLQAVESGNPELVELARRYIRAEAADRPFRTWTPRPDNADSLDQQTSFVTDPFDGMKCAIAGNGSGKSVAAAWAVARFLRTTPPPCRNCPFWVLSQSLGMVCGSCWGQKLSEFLPPSMIDHISWYNKKTNKPESVILKPHPNGNNWMIELKSYDQDREHLQAMEIGGFWCDEQCPYHILIEVWMRCRKWNFPGSKFYTLTPLMPDEILEEYTKTPEDHPEWKFYRMNSRCNSALPPGYVERIVENELEELRETRLTGAFASFTGAIYPMFSASTHVVEPFAIPAGWKRFRGIDFGFSHPTCAVYIAQEPSGRLYAYREYAQSQTLAEQHVKALNHDWDERNPAFMATWADTEDAQARAEFGRCGLATLSADKAVKRGILCVRRALQTQPDGKPGLLVFDHCKTLVKQLRSYRWHPIQPDKPYKVDEDMCDALRYCLMGIQSFKVNDFEPLKVKPRKKSLYSNR